MAIEQLPLFPELPADLVAAGIALDRADSRFLVWDNHGAQQAPVVFAMSDLATNIANARAFLAAGVRIQAELAARAEGKARRTKR